MYGGLGPLDSTSDVLTRLEDFWVFDLASRTWTHVPRTEPWPGVRNGHAIDYSGVGKKIYLFGGDGEHPCPPELWSYSTTERTWRALGEMSPQPRGRSWISMTVDQGTGDPWVFFGSCSGDFAESDYLKFAAGDGQWSSFLPPMDGPLTRAAHVSAYDSKTGTILLFGGWIPQVAVGPRVFAQWTAVWNYDPRDDSWEQLSTPDSSDARFTRWAVGSYDPVSDLFLVHGGLVGSLNSRISSDVWAFDMRSRQWHQLNEAMGAAPAGRYAAAGAYCPCTGEEFISGGRTSKNQSYDSVSPDAFFIPIETRADFAWRGPETSAMNSSAPRWGILTFPNGSEAPAEFEDGSVRLVECTSGTTLQKAKEMSRIGRYRWKIQFQAPSEIESIALKTGHVVLTGRPIRSAVNFIAPIQGRARSVKVPLGQVSESADTALLAPEEMGSPNYELALGAAHPNPSSGTVSISFTMAQQGSVSIGVYDVAGRLVKNLVDGSAKAGPHDIVWDLSDNGGRRVGAGVYFYRMDASSWRSQRKVVFLKR
jgi:flagellar hook capping protein FlgD/galactose oxidase-like protein